MASEESKLNNDEVNNNPSSGEQEPAPSISTQSAPKDASPSAASRADDDEESRPPGDVDFGQLLDQFEQEQASLQEGEVVRGTVVGISERGVVIDFGYKSEGIVNPAEFTENGVLAVKPGDEVDVLVKNMETADGLPVLSRADAVRMKAWDDLEKSHREGTSAQKGQIGADDRAGTLVHEVGEEAHHAHEHHELQGRRLHGWPFLHVSRSRSIWRPLRPPARGISVVDLTGQIRGLTETACR